MVTTKFSRTREIKKGKGGKKNSKLQVATSPRMIISSGFTKLARRSLTNTIENSSKKSSQRRKSSSYSNRLYTKSCQSLSELIQAWLTFKLWFQCWKTHNFWKDIRSSKKLKKLKRVARSKWDKLITSTRTSSRKSKWIMIILN